VAARGAAAAESAGQPPAALRVRFPLVESEELALLVPPDCVAASRHGDALGAAAEDDEPTEEPRLATSRSLRLGALLLRAVRTAKNEESAVAHLEELLLSPADAAAAAGPRASSDIPTRRVLLYVDPGPDYQEGAEFNAVAAAVEMHDGVSCEYVYSGSTAEILERKGIEVAGPMRAPDEGDEREEDEHCSRVRTSHERSGALVG
jgi:hypothetical protein